MPTLTPEYALSLWHLAAEQELGLRVPIPPGESPQTVQNRLYEARVSASTPEIEALSLRVTGDKTEVIIYKKAEAKLEP